MSREASQRAISLSGIAPMKRSLTPGVEIQSRTCSSGGVTASGQQWKAGITLIFFRCAPRAVVYRADGKRRLNMFGGHPFKKSEHSLFRDSGLAQSGEITVFGKTAYLWRSPRRYGPEPGDAGIAVVTHQTAGFRELGRGPFGITG